MNARFQQHLVCHNLTKAEPDRNSRASQPNDRNTLAGSASTSPAGAQTTRPQTATNQARRSNVLPSSYERRPGSNPFVIRKQQQHLVQERRPPRTGVQRGAFWSGPQVRPPRDSHSVRITGGSAGRRSRWDAGHEESPGYRRRRS
ncbi:uncharacterized protein DSM5745_06069 [Aspergillus mulundensis]|uniref:Uncharacterized protein n=1 Tax=Aspergillus mulundensis TaxID=1810919 RepID=A0A3D8RYT0_9EURO|nr:hypothetical protein DSM5745_06069 [Aspergillus mulundensis]RDW79217.1 hypothetical protein DSM5745_06069 [Aspergillus mulundensis]